MNGAPATYKGRIVSKEHFRAYIYAPNGNKKLVESWDEFERHMETGLWFANKKDAVQSVVAEVVEDEKPKAKKKPVKMEVVKEVDVKEIEDDFLPKDAGE